jgi:aquaporin Z
VSSTPSLARRLAAEAFGAFSLVFAGTGAIIVNDVSNGALTHAGISLVFGLIVLAMIYTVGDVSGAHLNPAVTLGFFVAGRIPFRPVVPYIAVQCLSATTASLALRLIFPKHPTLGATLPSDSVAAAFVFEFVMTLILMVVVLSVSKGGRERGITAGIVVGSVIALEALFGGPISGASMNPARSLGPAIVSGTFSHHWIYWAAPLLGAVVATGVFRAIHSSESEPHAGD